MPETEAPVVVLAVFTPTPGRAAELRAALVEAIPAVHGEDGCKLYAIHDGPDEVVYMIEKWTSAALLDAHGSGAPVTRLRELVDGLAADVAVTRMAPIPAGTPEQGLL